MTTDELIVLIVCAMISFFTWGRWYRMLFATFARDSFRVRKPLLAGIPPACLFVIFVMLKTTASFDVRDSAIYLLFYTIFGAAWLGAGIFLLRGIGFYPCDDAIERNNPAAAVAVCLSFVGLAECYAGANIGDGPGWWCVLFAGGLATFVWLCLLSMYQAVGRVAEEVTVERNMNSAIRFGGFAIAAGFVCGRGAAGDWTSAQQTIIEFFDVWPLLGLIVIACFTEHFASAGYRDGQRIENRHQSPVPAFLCAWFYIATAIVTVLFFIPPIP